MPEDWGGKKNGDDGGQPWGEPKVRENSKWETSIEQAMGQTGIRAVWKRAKKLDS